MTTLQDIDQLARAYADSRKALGERVDELNQEIEAQKRKRMPSIRRAIEKAAADRDALHNAIDASRHLFARPRTVVVHGLKIGVVKGTGKIEWEDDAQVVALIRKKLPELADTLIKTAESPVRKQLKDLSVADLKRIGVTVEESGDHVLIKATDSDVDKLVAKLLTDAVEAQEQ